MCIKLLPTGIPLQCLQGLSSPLSVIDFQKRMRNLEVQSEPVAERLSCLHAALERAAHNAADLPKDKHVSNCFGLNLSILVQANSRQPPADSVSDKFCRPVANEVEYGHGYRSSLK